jgi:crotonobetainyl-CoA:carnitine CoA-transferase CaiB-like acyl-CoA transferase
VTLPLRGIRVVEYAQYVAGPLCGLLLAELGAEVVKVEPPVGDGYRRVMPIAPGLGRYFVPLNRGKRSVVLDLKTDEGRAGSRALLETADIVLHNLAAGRDEAFGLAWDSLHERHPALVLGVVTAFGLHGPLAGERGYDLVAQARSGLLTAHASRGDDVPVRAGGMPIADLTAGMLLSTSVLAALSARAENGGTRVEVSLLQAALAMQVQDLVWLEGDVVGGDARTTPGDLGRRADEIALGLRTNPYYRCYRTVDGYVAVACLNLLQRTAFLDLLALDDPTIDAPDVVPDDAGIARGKHELTAEIEARFASEPIEAWTARLAAAGVPCGPVLTRERIADDEQVAAAGLLRRIDQPGFGQVTTLSQLVAGGAALPAPGLGDSTAAILDEVGA